MISKSLNLGVLLFTSVSLFIMSGFLSETKRPNIIIFLADDQGHMDTGYMGHTKLKTPVMDKMADNGLTFTRFYSAASVCTPTRANILTGRHPNRFGAFNWGHTLRPQESTLAEVLKEAGYVTGHFGKWHLGPMVANKASSPGESGFDKWISAYNFYDNNPWLSDNGIVRKYKGGSANIISDLAIEFIEKSVNSKKPFFAAVWFSNPHKPYKPRIDLK